MPIEALKTQLGQHRTRFNALSKKSRSIGFGRLVVILGVLFFVYLFLRKQESLYLGVASAALVVFVFLVRWFSLVSFQKKLTKALVDINEDELNYLEKDALSFADGKEFVDTGHAYSYDLDFFGERSLFQVLNRTETFMGKRKLAQQLLRRSSNAKIIENHEAIKELSGELEWRQKIQAYGKLTEDSGEMYSNLHRWTQTDKSPLTAWLNIASFVLPVVLIGLTTYNFTFDAGWGDYCFYLFLFNLFVVSRELKTIKKELIGSTNIDRTLRNYSLILEKMEAKEFSAKALVDLKKRLFVSDLPASKEIKKLSNLFDQLESILNPFGAILFNGFLLFHLHTLRGFRKWKAKNADKILDWMDVIGEMEVLISMSNFSQNNSEFTFPELNNDRRIELEDLGHPLLNRNKRVTSSVNFNEQSFIILTGSNMSGKSTFLRSLGVNMVLAGMGAPVCATRANVCPMPVYVSMRVSDSLNDNESFFFAEVKRLKEIMVAAEKEVSFVLLDEILRGTNSDDKRTGTVEVLKKIIGKKAIGALATHDLKVCDTAAEFPNQLVNKCFEVEIVNDDLYFDYKLRDGVCKNKSATFLMKKMQVI